MCENKVEIKDLVPNPILIRNKNNIEIATEKSITSFNIRRYGSIYEKT